MTLTRQARDEAVGDYRAGGASTVTESRRGVKGSALRALGVVTLGSLLVQSFHMVEHVLQVLQKYYWHVPAHGLLGAALDREWVHMAYNSTLEATLVAMLLGYGLWGRSALSEFPRGRAWGLYAFWGVVAFQGYHVGEHVVKMYQYISTGRPDTPGLAGQLFPTIQVHFADNLVVLALMIAAALGLGMISRAVKDIRGPSAPIGA